MPCVRNETCIASNFGSSFRRLFLRHHIRAVQMEDSLHQGSTAAKESWADLTDRDPKCFSPSSHPCDGEERAFVNEKLGGEDQGATETAGRQTMNAFGSPSSKTEDNDGTSGDHNGCKISLELERLLEPRQIEVFCEFKEKNKSVMVCRWGDMLQLQRSQL